MRDSSTAEPRGALTSPCITVGVDPSPVFPGSGPLPERTKHKGSHICKRNKIISFEEKDSAAD